MTEVQRRPVRRAAACLIAALYLPVTITAQQPDIGIAPVQLTEPSYVFDTAEQHRIRVVVVAKGLDHPFAFAILPSGDALVAERGGQLRLFAGREMLNAAFESAYAERA